MRARTMVAIPAQREDEMAEYRHAGNNDDLLRELTIALRWDI